MITAKLSDDERWLLLNTTDFGEKKQLQSSFTIEKENAIVLKRMGIPASECFINKYGMIPVGLWMELIRVCQLYNMPLTFTEGVNEKIKDCTLTKESFLDYINNLFKENEKVTPKDYQINTVFNLLQYKKCCAEISTSGGKTLITYMLFRYAIDVLGIKHILYITPKTMLTVQSADKFIEYDMGNNKENNWNYNEIHTGAKKKDDYEETIVFGNYQSVNKKKKEFFEKYEMVIIDEAHHGSCASIKTILSKCHHCKYKIGLTGTFPKERTPDNFTLQSYIGPVVYNLTSYDLINNENFATPVEVKMIQLKYLEDYKVKALYDMRCSLDPDKLKIGIESYNMEKKIMRDNPIRLQFICNMISKTTNNTLVIFSDIKTGYGQKIYNHLKNITDHKIILYIDGSTPQTVREKIKEDMENDESGNTILVASMGCFTEGVDIANMWNIFLVETTKSEVTVAQLLGRGMRRHPKKEKTIMIDFIDDFRYTGGNKYKKDNYLYKHGKERMSIYNKRRFPCVTAKVDLRKKDGSASLF